MPPLLDYLKNIVATVCEPYQAMPQTRAILSIGSVSYGHVDHYSDIDLAIYYEELPSPEQLEAAMKANGAEKLIWALGDRSEGGLIESYLVKSVECQFAHTTAEAWQKHMDSVLVDFDVDSPIQKALSGLLEGTPLFGAEFIEKYKEQARTYPEGLARAMVKRYLAFQPLWALEDRLKVRDTLLWRQQALVEGAQNILGVLAGLNHLYYTTFQFKRMGAFIDSMALKPVDLEARLTRMLSDADVGLAVYKGLVSELVALVEGNLPEADTAGARRGLAREDQKWEMVGE
jgi:hypothetical protein